MKLSVQVPIQARKEAIWKVITDIDRAPERISGIEKVKVLERPEGGLVGLKWEETRKMFGREASETMWITDAKENEFYETRAENHGAVYKSGMYIREEGGQTFLKMEFGSEATSFFSRIMAAIMTPFFKGATQKMMLQDLEDIKKAVEEK